MTVKHAGEEVGRVAIVTGAGLGLGRAYALELARRGLRVLVNNRRREVDAQGRGSADRVVEEIRAAGGTAIADYELGRTLALTDPSADRATARTALNRALVLQRQLDAQNPEYAEYRLFLTKIFRELSRLPGDNGYAAHEADTLAAELSARDPQRWEYQGL